jgi:hypothetical protein
MNSRPMITYDAVTKEWVLHYVSRTIGGISFWQTERFDTFDDILRSLTNGNEELG